MVGILILLVILRYKKIKSLTNNDTVNEMVKIKFDKTRFAILLSGAIAFIALLTIIYTFSISKNIVSPTLCLSMCSTQEALL